MLVMNMVMVDPKYASMERGIIGGRGDGVRCPWLAKWVKYSRGSGVKRERADKEDIAREEKACRR